MKQTVTNAANIYGEILKIDAREKATSCEVKTDTGNVTVFAFGAAKAIIDKFSEGDSVRLGATIQSDNKPEFPGITLVCNHITYGNMISEHPSNATFNVIGRLIGINKLSAHKATALIKTQKADGTATNNIRVFLENDNEEVINKFCSLKYFNHISIYGSIKDGELIVGSWRYVKPA